MQPVSVNLSLKEMLHYDDEILNFFLLDRILFIQSVSS